MYINDPTDNIFETSFWLVKIYKNDQIYLGRSYVILKRACGDLADITTEELLDFHEIVKKYELAFRKAFGAVMFNWTCLMNSAYQNNPPDPQVHWHVRPRYDKPVEFGGELFTDKVFGHHYERNTERSISEELKSQIIKMVQEYL